MSLWEVRNSLVMLRLRAVSAIYIESQSLELLSAARRDVFKLFRESFLYLSCRIVCCFPKVLFNHSCIIVDNLHIALIFFLYYFTHLLLPKDVLYSGYHEVIQVIVV